MSSSHRASLLNGLRTGGVRSVSASAPHATAPGATTFPVNHFPAQPHPTNVFPEDDDDQLPETPQHLFNYRNLPMSAAVDGNTHLSHQQAQYPDRTNFPFNLGFSHPSTMSPPIQTQAMSMQMLQLEMMRIQVGFLLFCHLSYLITLSINQQAQAIQNQQYQAELIAEAQRQQQQQHHHHHRNQVRRTQHIYQPPATTGPTNLTFDQRPIVIGAQSRRPNQVEHLRAQLGLGPAPASSADQVPMTAALGGRFGSRSASLNAPLNVAHSANNDQESPALPPTPSSTTVISGGTSLGNLPSNNIHPSSKSDSAPSWRRTGSNSVLAGSRAVSSPVVKVTAPDNECFAPPGSNTVLNARSRPQPLHFINPAVSESLPTVTVIDTDEDGDVDADSSSSSGKTHSSPTTPRSSASSNEIPLSPREEASKKLYEGLGIGRSSSASPEHHVVSVVNHRMVSQPTRQPRGPPSGADELGPKNFATRIRRKAIGGLLDARGRREVEAF